MLQIYSPKLSSRLRYICNFLLKEMLGLNFTFNHDLESFRNFSGIKFNYSDADIENIPHIKPVDILFENGIKNQEINCSDYTGTKIFFRNEEQNSFPFDLFSASFFLLSRYEEYLPFSADQHGRFPATGSIAYKEGFLNQPVIHLWLAEFKKYLFQYYPDLKFKEHKFDFISSIDVDNGYAYIGKSIFRTAGGIVKALIKGNSAEFFGRLKAISGMEKDPFDCYSFQKQIKDEFRIKMIYFLLCGRQGPNDHNISAESKEFKKLVGYLKTFADIGLHPSYSSNLYKDRLLEEKKVLENIIDSPILKSRQHFLKMSLPETYNNLIKAGIKEDYSMGYASHPGFRAGISTPYSWYDLKSETEKELKIFPFQFMDISFMDYQQVKPEEAIRQIIEIIKSVKSVKGLLISIWHDRTFAPFPKNSGWNDVYLKVMNELRKEG